MFERILLATDFSMSAMSAARTARDLRRAFDAKLTLLHAYDPALLAKDEAIDYLTVLRDERFAEDADIELIAAPHRSADVAICAEAMANKADLIVAGRHGEHGLGERLLGTVTERVVRHAPCSVWVAHPATREPTVLTKHIVAATDLSEASLGAIRSAAALARAFDSWVTLLHSYDVFPPLDMLRRDEAPDEPHAFGERVEQALEKLRSDHLDGVPAAAKVVRDKSAVTAICDFAANEGADLVVTGTHGRTGVPRLLIGSVAERMIRHAPCSVLVVR